MHKHERAVSQRKHTLSVCKENSVNNFKFTMYYAFMYSASTH